MRKKLNLNVTDYINVSILPPSDRVQMIEKWKNYIASETRAKNIEISDKKQELIETWDIEGEQYIIGISKAD